MSSLSTFLGIYGSTQIFPYLKIKIFSYLKFSIQSLLPIRGYTLLKSPCDLMASILFSWVVQLPQVFFYGTSQEDENIFGAGILIKLSVCRFYICCMSCAHGSNTKSELQYPFNLLIFASRVRVTHLQVLGISKTIIGWDIRHKDFWVLNLHWWQDFIRTLQRNFQVINFSHAHKVYNS